MKIVLDEGAFLPKKAHDSDAGFDLYAREDFVVPPTVAYGADFFHHGVAEVGCAIHDTGVHIELPQNTVGLIKSKSGLNVKHGLTAEGVIDVGYTGSIMVKIYNHTSEQYQFRKGDKITQLVILPIAPLTNSDLTVVDELDFTERGFNGFGSTGK